MQENASLKEKNKYVLTCIYLARIQMLTCALFYLVVVVVQSQLNCLSSTSPIIDLFLILWLSIRIILAKSNKVRRVSTWEIQYMIEGLNLTIEGPFLTCFMFLEWSRTTCWSSSYIVRLHYEIFMFEFPFFCSLLLQCYCSNMHKTNFNTFHCLLFEANWCSRARTYTYSSHSITVILN